MLSNKLLLFRILSFILLGLWMLLIFAFSSQNSEKSSKTSGSVVTEIIEKIYPEYETFSPEKKTVITDTITRVVRKTAHFSEYFILGALSFFAASTFKPLKPSVRTAFAFVFCVLYSITDEVHQYFVPGRACRFTDILIDGAGSLISVILLTVIIKASRKGRNKSGDIYA